MELTLVTFLYGMRAAERAGEIEQGLELFRRMKVKGIKSGRPFQEAADGAEDQRKDRRGVVSSSKIVFHELRRGSRRFSMVN